MSEHRTRTPAVLVAMMIMPMIVGCAGLTPSEAPGCKGPRRSANPHGSVLSAETTPAPAVGAAGGQCARSQP